MVVRTLWEVICTKKLKNPQTMKKIMMCTVMDLSQKSRWKFTGMLPNGKADTTNPLHYFSYSFLYTLKDRAILFRQ